MLERILAYILEWILGKVADYVSKQIAIAKEKSAKEKENADAMEKLKNAQTTAERKEANAEIAKSSF